MTLKKTALASAIALALAGQTVTAVTTTTNGSFIADKLEATIGSGVVNISIMGLNAQGEVDLTAEEGGSSIIATVISNKGEVKDCYATPNEAFDPIGTESAGQRGTFAASVKYCKLVNGKARVNVEYNDVNVTGTDTITVNLFEWDPTVTAGTARTKISEAIKTITLNPPGENTMWIAVESFTKGSTADDIDNTDGVNGTIVAGAAGAQITVNAYNASGKLDETAFGTVALNLISTSDAKKLGNDATPAYVLEANMVKGVAIFTIEKNEVTVEDEYFMQALFTQGETTHDSVDLFIADTLTVNDKGVATKLKISEKNGKSRISNDENTNASAIVKVELLDEYGNSMTARSERTITLADANGILIASPVNITILKGGDSALREFGGATTPAAKPGTSALTATMKNAPGIAASDALAITVLEENLIARTTLSGACDGAVVPTQGQKADVTFDGFCVGVDTNADGALTDGTEIMSSDTATPMTIQNRTKSVIEGRETIDVSIDVGENLAKGRFRGATASSEGTGYAGDTFLISDAAGQYGQTLVSGAYFIRPGEISVAEVRNAINHTVNALTARPALNANDDLIQPIQFNVDIAEKAVKMLDNFGNIVTGSTNKVGTFNALSMKGTPDNAVSELPTAGDNILLPGSSDNDVVRITYQTEGPTAFAGVDTVDFAYTIPRVTGGVSVFVPELPIITGITANIEQTAIPVNGEVALTIEVRDQYGELIDPEGGVTINFSGDDLVPTVINNDSGSAIAGGAKIDLTTGGGRVVLVVKGGAEEGEFTLSFVSADDPSIMAEKTFTVTRELVQECASTVLNLCTTETECTAVGGIWDAETASCSAAPPVCSMTNVVLCEDEASCINVGGEWNAETGACNEPLPVCAADNLSACLDESSCVTVGGQWNGASCEAVPVGMISTGLLGLIPIDSLPPVDVTIVGTFNYVEFGEDSRPMFRGGFFTADNGTWKKSGVMTQPNEPVIIAGDLMIAPEHVGESVDVLVVGHLQGAGQESGYYYVVQKPFPFNIYDWDEASIIGAYSTYSPAPAHVAINMYEGALPFPGAHLRVYFGYRVTTVGHADEGTIFFNLYNTVDIDIGG